MKLKSILVVILLVQSFVGASQVINIKSGVSVSNLNWIAGPIGAIYKEKLLGYSLFAGVDYFNHDFYNLSFNAGVLRKGGSDEFFYTDEEGNIIGSHKVKAYLDYVSLNCLFEVKYPLNNILPYVSLGPHYDFTFSHSNEIKVIEEVDGLNKFAFGVLCGGGLKYDLTKLQLGIGALYMLDVTKIGEWTIESTGYKGEVTDNTFTVHVSIGYKL